MFELPLIATENSPVLYTTYPNSPISLFYSPSEQTNKMLLRTHISYSPLCLCTSAPLLFEPTPPPVSAFSFQHQEPLYFLFIPMCPLERTPMFSKAIATTNVSIWLLQILAGLIPKCCCSFKRESCLLSQLPLSPYKIASSHRCAPPHPLHYRYTAAHSRIYHLT